jgi:hypothetical protein
MPVGSDTLIITQGTFSGYGPALNVTVQNTVGGFDLLIAELGAVIPPMYQQSFPMALGDASTSLSWTLTPSQPATVHGAVIASPPFHTVPLLWNDPQPSYTAAPIVLQPTASINFSVSGAVVNGNIQPDSTLVADLSLRTVRTVQGQVVVIQYVHFLVPASGATVVSFVYNLFANGDPVRSVLQLQANTEYLLDAHGALAFRFSGVAGQSYLGDVWTVPVY